MFRKILIPLDTDENVNRMAKWATGLAKPQSPEIVLLHVVGEGGFGRAEYPGEGRRFGGAGSAGTATGIIGTTVGADAPHVGEQKATPTSAQIAEQEAGYGEHPIDQTVRRAKDYVETHRLVLERDGLNAAVMVRVGEAAPQIMAQAKSMSADLIVMATHRRSAVTRGLLGSVTDEVLRHTEVPLFVLHPRAMQELGQPITHVVLPLDGSELSESAIPVALQLAAATGASITFLRAIVGGRAEIARQYLIGHVDSVGGQGVAAAFEVARSDAASAISDIAAIMPGSVIVMTTHGASGFRRAIVGSVTDQVIRHSGHPVLVVPSAASQAA